MKSQMTRHLLSTCAAAAFALLTSHAALAGTPVLGVELGVSTLDQVRSTQGQKAELENAGVNEYTGGPMLVSEGTGYGIEGLRKVAYIFDSQKKLAAVLMTLEKGRFDTIARVVAGKYKLRSQERPFVGNQQATFQTGDGVIELNAPHMSFEMTALYARSDLMQQFKTQSKRAKDAKAASEASKF